MEEIEKKILLVSIGNDSFFTMGSPVSCDTLSGAKQARPSVMLRSKFYVPKASPANFSNTDNHTVGCAKKYPYTISSQTFIVIPQNNIVQTQSDSELHHYGFGFNMFF